MFCPKCGTENPDTGKFCRACGTDLGNVSEALSGKLPKPPVDRKGRPISTDGAITTFFMGIAFMVVSIILGVTGMGRGWWFWMLIPAFGMIGSSIAKFVQLKRFEQARGAGFGIAGDRQIAATPASSLPPSQSQYIPPVPQSRYKTGDLVPPSVTEGTTRHLEVDSEGKTMTLPKS